MPTTINVNAAGYDLDAGGVTGSIVSGTLFLGHASNLGGQLRAKAITDTPAIIAQAYAGTANAFEVWDSLGNVVASCSKIGQLKLVSPYDPDQAHAATIDGNALTCNYSTFTINNTWSSLILNGNTGVSIQNTGGATTIGGPLTMVPAASATPSTNGQLTFEATSNTSLTIKYKGSDGTVRSNILTLS